MLKHPIFHDGQKVIIEDIAAIAQLAGVADDAVRGSVSRMFVEGTNAKGYVETWRDGPIVTSNGASGTLAVAPFRAFRSAVGSTTNAGTETASEDTATHEEVISAYYPGGTVTVPTPPTVASGNVRWDLLYAIVTETEADAASRQVVAPGVAGGVQTVFTRRKSVATLAWVQGTAIAEGAVPTSGQLGQLPTATIGTAVAPLAYVRVNKTDTPSTVAYSVHQIANAPRKVHQNGGAFAIGGITADPTSVVPLQVDPVTLLTRSTSHGGWGSNATDKRPASYIGQISKGGSMLLTIGPFGGAAIATGTWAVLATPIATPDVASALYDRQPIDWRNRVFRASLCWGYSVSFAWDGSVAAGARQMPSAPLGVGVIRDSFGNSVAENTGWNASSGIAGYRLAALFSDVAGTTTNDDVALLVSTSTGALHLGVRETTSGIINSSVGIIDLRYSGQLDPYGL